MHPPAVHGIFSLWRETPAAAVKIVHGVFCRREKECTVSHVMYPCASRTDLGRGKDFHFSEAHVEETFNLRQFEPREELTSNETKMRGCAPNKTRHCSSLVSVEAKRYLFSVLLFYLMAREGLVASVLSQTFREAFSGPI